MSTNPVNRHQEKSQLPPRKTKQEKLSTKEEDEIEKKFSELYYSKKSKSSPKIININIDAKTFFTWLYNANPFYLISTCLILYAQTIIFNTSNLDLNTAISVGVIAGYTLLLMGAAVLILRLGKVWNDLRSIALIITVLLFFLSVSLDRIALDGLQTGLLWQGGCLLFALTVSYTIYRELKIRLSGSFLTVFCALLGLFFLYPSLPAYLVNENVGNPIPAIQTVLLFPVLSSILFLFLIPAASQGKAAVKENPTPWRWPLCPWIIFGILWLCAGFRTYLMTISFYGGKGVGPYSKLETGFNIYMLIPLVFAACVLLVEYGIANRKQWVQSAALVGPILFFLMAIPVLATPRPYYLFLESVLGKNGSPFIFAAIAAVLFYIYALFRRIKYTEISLGAVLLLISLGEIKLGMVNSLGIASWIPAVITTSVFVLIALMHRSAASNFISLSGIVLLLTMQFKNSWFTAYHGAIPVNLLLFGAMVIMNYYRGAFARFLSKVIVGVLPLFCALALCYYRQAPWYFSSVYILLLMALGGIQVLMFNDRKYIISEAVNILFLIIFGCHIGLQALGKLHVKGLRIVFWGMLFFITAFVVSMFKGGVPQRLFRRYLSQKKRS
jgi:hypothetical protein